MIIQEALKEPLKDFKILPWKQLLDKYDKYSLRSWLTDEDGGNLSADTIDYIAVFYNMESFLDGALVEILIDECIFEDPQFQYILHGNTVLKLNTMITLSNWLYLIRVNGIYEILLHSTLS